MSPEIMRRAARLIRDRAKLADDVSKWDTRSINGPRWIPAIQAGENDKDFDAVAAIEENCTSWIADEVLDPAVAEHIAGFDPAVAFALADLLDCFASCLEQPHAYPGMPRQIPSGDAADRALAIALAYLREDS